MARNQKQPIVPPVLFIPIAIALFGLIIAFLIKDADLALLNPKGTIANDQSRLMVLSTLIMLGFGVPVILTLYFFIWKYREGNTSTSYNPEENTSKAMMAFAWGGPFVVVAILAALLIPATHRLDPNKSIESDKKQMTIQVVSLNWKWLFIYPEQDVATVNYVQFPVDTPVRFELTADNAPMSSFWIPHLGGMLYTMTGHVNPLNLMGDTIGDYPGASAEINGAGFAGMKFMTRVSSREDFDAWLTEIKQSPSVLDDAEYKKLLEPSENHEPTYYSSSKPSLFDDIVNKYSTSHLNDHGYQSQESAE